jgi:hypothetical protein
MKHRSNTHNLQIDHIHSDFDCKNQVEVAAQVAWEWKVCRTWWESHTKTTAPLDWQEQQNH